MELHRKSMLHGQKKIPYLDDEHYTNLTPLKLLSTSFSFLKYFQKYKSKYVSK
jgi:hypothetical protein